MILMREEGLIWMKKEKSIRKEEIDPDKNGEHDVGERGEIDLDLKKMNWIKWKAEADIDTQVRMMSTGNKKLIYTKKRTYYR